MAESAGIEPARPLRDDGLANRSITTLATLHDRNWNGRDLRLLAVSFRTRRWPHGWRTTRVPFTSHQHTPSASPSPYSGPYWIYAIAGDQPYLIRASRTVSDTGLRVPSPTAVGSSDHSNYDHAGALEEIRTPDNPAS